MYSFLEKRLCYKAFVTVFSCSSEACSVLVVFPLLSIVHAQCDFLERLGVRVGDSDVDGAVLKNEELFYLTREFIEWQI